MKNTITLAQYVKFLKETLEQLDKVAKDSPDIELKRLHAANRNLPKFQRRRTRLALLGWNRTDNSQKHRKRPIQHWQRNRIRPL